MRWTFADSFLEAVNGAGYAVTLASYLRGSNDKSDVFILGKFKDAIREHSELAIFIDKTL
jgi:hypothetical protein